MQLKRKLYIYKCRARILFRRLVEKVLLQLSEWDWIVCHNVGMSNTTDDGKIHTAPEIANDRFIFSVSYIIRKYEKKREYWFKTKKGRILYTIENTHHIEGRVSYRAELKAFYAHFSPRQRMWVDYTSPVVQLVDSKGFFQDLSKDSVTTLEVKIHRCDFSQCRYAFEFAFDYCHGKEVSPEVLSQSHRALANSLTSKVTEINKILTGADYDGEMMSPKKMPLCDNILCKKCGLPVFASAEDKYQFECLYHGEVGLIDVSRVDPIQYKNVVENTLEILEDLIAKKSCPQDSNL